ncbi:MAG: hypothetical protein ACI9VN_001246 [Patescibacteria group bacterium]|jgi:hypothetical protein
MTKKYFLTLILGITCSLILSAQSERIKKNSIVIFYTPTFSKTNLIDNNSSWVSDQFFLSKKPTSSFTGFQIGFRYSRYLSKKVNIFLSYSFTQKGQETSHYFNSFGRDPADHNPGWGGGSWDVRLTTNEFILGSEYQLYLNKKGNLSVGIKVGIPVDVYQNMIIQDYLIEAKTGLKRNSCCSLGGDLPREEWMNNLRTKFKDREFRLGLVLGSPIYLKLIGDLIWLNVTPEIEFLSNLVDAGPDIHNVKQGNIFTAGLQFGASVHF